MKTIKLLAIVVLALGVLSAEGAWAGRRSDRNKNSCLNWCRANRSSGCEKCARTVGCGSGYKSYRKFGRGAPAWYACRKSAFGRRGAANETACRNYCRSNRACVRCVTGACGRGQKRLKSFRGSGKDWFACQRTRWAANTDRARADAQRWCADYRRRSPGSDCRIVKSGKSCPRGFYKAERLKVRWGRDFKACLTRKIARHRVKDCTGNATGYIERALAWLDTNKSNILSGFRLQPSDYRNRRAHARMDRKWPKITIRCRHTRRKCRKDPNLGGWSATARSVYLCYNNIKTFCQLVMIIMHEAGHNAWADIVRPHNTNPDVARDTVYQLGFRARDLCRGPNGRNDYNLR